jgi:hypothetical protein
VSFEALGWLSQIFHSSQSCDTIKTACLFLAQVRAMGAPHQTLHTHIMFNVYSKFPQVKIEIEIEIDAKFESASGVVLKNGPKINIKPFIKYCSSKLFTLITPNSSFTGHSFSLKKILQFNGMILTHYHPLNIPIHIQSSPTA